MNTPNQGGLPPSLRLLQGLVTGLMAVMILAVITVVWLLVTRMPDMGGQIPPLPDKLALPAGQVAQAVTYGNGVIIVLTQSQDLLIFDAQGHLRQTVALPPTN